MPSPIIVPMVPELIFGGRAHAFPHRRVYGPRAYIRRPCTCLPPSSCLWSPSLYSEVVVVHMPSPIVVSMVLELVFGGRAHAFPHRRVYGPRAYIRRSCTCLPPSSCLWSPSLYSEVVHMPSPIVVPMVPELIFGGRDRAHAFPHRRVYGPRAYIRRSCTCLPPSSCLWSPSLYSEVVHMPSPIVVSMVPELIFGGRAHAFPHRRVYGPRAYIRRPWSCTCLPPSSCLWSPSLYSEVVHMPSPIVVPMVPELIFGGRAHAFPHRRSYGPRAYIRMSCTCLPPSSCLWSPSLYSDVVHMPSPIVVSMVPELIFGCRAHAFPIVVSMVPELIFGGRAHAFPHRRAYGPRAYIWMSCTCLPPSSCLWSPSLYSEVVHMPSPIVVPMVPELIFGGRAHAFPHRRAYGPRAYIRRSCTCLPPSSCLWSPSLYSEVVHMPSTIVVPMVPELIFGCRAHAFPIVVSMVPELIFGGRAHAFPHRRAYGPRAYIRMSCTCLPPSSFLWSPSLYSEVVHMPSPIVVPMVPELIFGGRAHAFPHRRSYGPRAYIRMSCTCLPPSSCLWSPSLYSDVVHMPSPIVVSMVPELIFGCRAHAFPIVVSMVPELIFGGRAHAFPHRRAYGPRAYLRRS